MENLLHQFVYNLAQRAVEMSKKRVLIAYYINSNHLKRINALTGNSSQDDARKYGKGI